MTLSLKGSPSLVVKTKGRFVRVAGALPAGFLLLALSACGPGVVPPGHDLSGDVVGIESEEMRLIVDHEEIPGVLPAAIGHFRASPGDLANARPGQRIRGRLIQSEGEWRLERIWPDDLQSRGVIDRTSLALRQDTMTRGSRVFREVGEQAPVFALFNQDGEVVQVNRYRGRHLVINFIYTRCPVPTMCPASTLRMIQLQEAAKEAGISNLELISITLDPEFDTPGILREYADHHSIDTSNFSFLTGPQNAINDLMAQMGIMIEGDVSNHTLGTALIDAGGGIRHRVFGSNWMVGDFLSRLKALETDASGK